MDQQHQLELIRGAQKGSRDCLEELALQAKNRLRTYVFRMTQQEDLTQEIVQESLFEMFKVIGKLREADRFWPWLYGIATNKLRRHYRTESTRRRIAASSAVNKRSYRERQDGLENLVSEELRQIVAGAMKKLKTRHKAVLVMRCYDDMPYSEIAASMGCSEFSTRMLFMRAKRALQKELSRNGFGKGSLLAALIVFGKITAPSEAAAAQISVTSATVNVGLLAGLAGLATTKTALISLTAAGAITAGTVAINTNQVKQVVPGPHPSMFATENLGRNSSAGEEYQYYFPLGPAEPLLLRAKSSSIDDDAYWQVLQNQEANYYYYKDRIHINNYNMWAEDLSVLRLPTDDPAFVSFISRMDGSTTKTDYVNASGNGLLVVGPDNDQVNGSRPWAIRHYSVMDEDFFQADWPITARTIDNRDEMHKRGWTFFRVSGQINGKDINGSGRIPFVYNESLENSPWIRIKTEDMTIVDTFNEAYTYQSQSSTLGVYQGGSFFKGLVRPWMGMHSIDIVRRDAAEKRIPFETSLTQNGRFARIKLEYDGLNIIYNIDLETDVVKEITFSTQQGIIGNLEFTYLQSIGGYNMDFDFPNKPRRTTVSKGSPGILWLQKIADGSLE